MSTLNDLGMCARRCGYTRLADVTALLVENIEDEEELDLRRIAHMLNGVSVIESYRQCVDVDKTLKEALDARTQTLGVIVSECIRAAAMVGGCP